MNSAMTLEQATERAAEILIREARCIKNSCSGTNRQWACGWCGNTCERRKEHDEMIEIAVKIRGNS